jgi:uncharacterized membrane protein
MRASASFDLKTLARLAGFLLLGGLGSVALLTPLAGVLAYLAIPFYPLLLAWFLYGVVLAVNGHPRMARVYVLSNSGVLLATLIAFVATFVRLALSARQPDTAVTAPLYLALVLAGLLIGTAVALRRRTAPTQSR